MDSVAMIAVRACGQSPYPKPALAHRDETASHKPWRRAPRTKAALAIKMFAIQKVLRLLERLNLAFSQPLAGKLVIEPCPGVASGKLITFWPARGRLRIGRRPTKTQKGLHPLLQALADQGHPIQGYLSRVKPLKPPTVSSVEQLLARREANLATMAQAHAQRVAFFRQSLDLEGHRIGRRDPRSARVRRLFRCAWLRAV
jgi:hypothetical protein